MIDYVRGEDYDSTADDSQTSAASKRLLSEDGELLERDRRLDEEEFREWNGGLRPGEGGKVGMAVIFNKAPLEGGVATWDYTLRFNYTYGVSMFEDQVGGVALFRQRARRIWVMAYPLSCRRRRLSFRNEGMVACTTVFSTSSRRWNAGTVLSAWGLHFSTRWSVAVFCLGGTGGKARTHQNAGGRLWL